VYGHEIVVRLPARSAPVTPTLKRPAVAVETVAETVVCAGPDTASCTVAVTSAPGSSTRNEGAAPHETTGSPRSMLSSSGPVAQLPPGSQLGALV